MQCEIDEFFRSMVGLSSGTTLVQLAVDGSWDSPQPKVYAYGGVVAPQSNWAVLNHLLGNVLEEIGRAHV